jgi:hypothetical protein
VPSPPFDQDLGLYECVEDFTIQQLVTELAVERFVANSVMRLTRRGSSSGT